MVGAKDIVTASGVVGNQFEPIRGILVSTLGVYWRIVHDCALASIRTKRFNSGPKWCLNVENKLRINYILYENEIDAVIVGGSFHDDRDVRAGGHAQGGRYRAGLFRHGPNGRDV